MTFRIPEWGTDVDGFRSNMPLRPVAIGAHPEAWRRARPLCGFQRPV